MIRLTIPKELQDILTKAPRHPNPFALDLYGLRQDARVRSVAHGQIGTTATIFGSPHKGSQSGEWCISIAVPCDPDRHNKVRDKNGCCIHCGSSGKPHLAPQRHAAKSLGLVPFQDTEGRYYWKEDTYTEFANPIKRYLYWTFNQHVDMEPDVLFDYSPG